MFMSYKSEDSANSVPITLNGEAFSAPEGQITHLLQALGLKEKKIAVERNREIVPRSLYSEVNLQPGDTIEIVNFVGGG